MIGFIYYFAFTKPGFQLKDIERPLNKGNYCFVYNCDEPVWYAAFDDMGEVEKFIAIVSPMSTLQKITEKGFRFLSFKAHFYLFSGNTSLLPFNAIYK